VGQEISNDTWVWVVIQMLDEKEQYLGQHDAKKDVPFIPAFFSKEDAQQCHPQLPRRSDARYEVQAIAYDHLARDAAANGFRIYMMDAAGKIIEEL
jgi:hypothetical protein